MTEHITGEIDEIEAAAYESPPWHLTCVGPPGRNHRELRACWGCEACPICDHAKLLRGDYEADDLDIDCATGYHADRFMVMYRPRSGRRKAGS